jgi:copper(I)-binding protein
MHVTRTLFPLLLGAFALASAARSEPFSKGDIVVDQPWTRPTPEGATVGAGYATITNNGSTTDRLTGGSLDGAGKVEVHEMTMDGDVMKMRQLTDGLEIKPGATVELKPGSYHLMFLDLKQPIVDGMTVKGSLSFEKAGSVDVGFKATKAGPGMEHTH